MKELMIFLYYYMAVKFYHMVLVLKRGRINVLRDENKELKRKLGIDE